MGRGGGAGRGGGFGGKGILGWLGYRAGRGGRKGWLGVIDRKAFCLCLFRRRTELLITRLCLVMESNPFSILSTQWKHPKYS